jgi:hypothetical protein
MYCVKSPLVSEPGVSGTPMHQFGSIILSAAARRDISRGVHEKTYADGLREFDACSGFCVDHLAH